MAITGAQLLTVVRKGVADARRARDQLGHFRFGGSVSVVEMCLKPQRRLLSALILGNRQPRDSKNTGALRPRFGYCVCLSPWASSPLGLQSGASFIIEVRHLKFNRAII